MREQLRPNEQRAKAAILLIWLCFVAEIFSIFSNFLHLWIYNNYEEGIDVADNIVSIADFSEGFVALLGFAVGIVSVVTFIRWFRRAYYNLGVKLGTTEYSDGWAAGSWFVPIMNLFVPYRIMKELYVRTDEYLLVDSSEPYTERLKTNLLGWWWALWIISAVAGRIFLRLTLKANALNELMDVEIFSVVISVMRLVLCVITIYIIQNYSSIESYLQEEYSDSEEPRLDSVESIIIEKNNNGSY
ncbi:MAG: DUF4328 domain-containing protein [Dysgonomonas sp.]